MIFNSRLTYLSVLLVLFFFQCSTKTYPSNYYVDGDLTTGSNDGTSWDNAWQSFSAIKWSSINPGDVVYISGGSDSTFYYEQLNIAATGTPGNLITIRAGLDAGHNGRVIIDAQGRRNHAVLVYGGNSKGYLRLVKLEGRRSVGQGTFGILSGESHSEDINVVYIDSCTITDILGHGGVFINGNSASGQVPYWQTTSYSDSIYVRWCYMRYQDQYPSLDAGRDGIFVQSSRNIFIEGNTIINNNEVTTRHSDNIQCMYVHNVKVWHNRMYCKGNTVSKPNQVFMWESMGDTLVIYGNELYAPNHTDYMNNVLDKNQVYPKIYYVINNVIYGGSADQNLFNISTDTAYCYNNIFQHGVPVSTAGVQYIYPLSSYTGDWAWTDSNLYGDNCGKGFYGFSIKIMNSWGAETSGNPSARYLVDPLFVDAPDRVDKGIEVDFRLKSTSPARNAGVDVQSIIEGLGLPYTDIDGKSLDSVPDCGAYQY